MQENQQNWSDQFCQREYSKIQLEFSLNLNCNQIEVKRAKGTATKLLTVCDEINQAVPHTVHSQCVEK